MNLYFTLIKRKLSIFFKDRKKRKSSVPFRNKIKSQLSVFSGNYRNFHSICRDKIKRISSVPFRNKIKSQLSVFFRNKNKIDILSFIGWLLLLISVPVVVTVFFLERFLMMTWGNLTLEEILYHLKTSIKGTNPEMVRDALVHYGIPALLISALLIALLCYLPGKKNIKRKILVPIILTAELACLFYVKNDMDRRLNFSSYVRRNINGKESYFIEDHYVNPNGVSLSFPEKKRNLVFIFLESMETTYSDTKNGGAFPENVIPNLTKLARENEDFSGNVDDLNGGISLPGSTWTMGAMFAYGTGAPLKIPLNGNKMENRDSFFPNMPSIGTVLKKEGYSQELLIGSDAVFGGRDVFYKSHGDFTIEDYKAAVKKGRIDEDYSKGWGYEDEKLFQYAREELEQLSKEDKPFNLTMLTVDTHFEDGSICRLCKDDFDEQYANVFACSDRQVTKFVRWIQDQDFYKDTTIILCGDHPTMDKDFCQDVPSDYQRRTYISVINGVADMDKSVSQQYRQYSTFDLFPTTLAAMGVTIPGNKLGLGVNLYSGEKTLIEEYGLKTCMEELDLPSEFMEAMSGIEVTEKTLKTVSRRAKIYYTKDKKYKDKESVDLSLYHVYNYLNVDTVKKVELVIKDKETGEESTHELEAYFPTENDPNVFLYKYTLPLHGKSLDDYEGTYYISIDGVDHYKIADFEEDLVEKDKD